MDKKLVDDIIAVERRNRIRLSAAAYAYEIMDESVISDAEFDALAERIDTSVKTGYRKLDTFFAKHFEPHTGQWIHKHPEKHELRRIVDIMRK